MLQEMLGYVVLGKIRVKIECEIFLFYQESLVSLVCLNNFNGVYTKTKQNESLKLKKNQFSIFQILFFENIFKFFKYLKNVRTKG